jgi:flagellar basal-body rod protein FlgB
MDLSQIPLFAMLRGRLGYLSERQRVISENVANSETPGFLPKDLKPFSFASQMALAETQARAALAPMTTQSGHISPARNGGPGRAKVKTVTVRDSETRLDGNAVVLEEQMMKMTDARMNYDAAISFYQKSLNLLRTAARAPGK